MYAEAMINIANRQGKLYFDLCESRRS